MPTKPRKRTTKAAAKVRAPKAAALAVSGAPPRKIAAALDLSASQASRVLKSPEVQQLIVMCANSHIGVLNSLFAEALGVIADAFKADRPDVVTKDGVCLPAGPDHFARLTAVGQLIKLFLAGRPVKAPDEAPARRGMTLQEVEARLGEHDASGGPTTLSR